MKKNYQTQDGSSITKEEALITKLFPTHHYVQYSSLSLVLDEALLSAQHKHSAARRAMECHHHLLAVAAPGHSWAEAAQPQAVLSVASWLLPVCLQTMTICCSFTGSSQQK